MKAITICQPYAHLIVIGHKRVENRTWPTSYRGPLLIHAGKSKAWLSTTEVAPWKDPAELQYGVPLADMAFGAIVGVAEMTGCVGISTGPNGSTFHNDAAVKLRWPWIHSHEHTEGPFCFVLENVHRFETPIPYRGAQGFFDIPDDIVRDALELKRALRGGK